MVYILRVQDHWGGSVFYLDSPSPTALARALLLSSSFAAPLALLGYEVPATVGSSEPSLTACLRRDPTNAWQAAPDSAQPGAPALKDPLLRL